VNDAAYELRLRGFYAIAAAAPAPNPHSCRPHTRRKVRDVVVSASCSPTGLVGVTVAGAVTRADERALVYLVHAAIARFGTVRVLVRVQPYAGPHHDGRFDPEGLWGGADVNSISRIAIVGEPAWKTVLPTTDRRPQVPIEYFATEQAARRWLLERCTPNGYRPINETRGVKRRIPR
jgi:hypothetical protein